MRNRVFRIGGFVSGGVLIAFGIAVIVLSVIGGNTVATNLKNEFISGTPDMTPSGIQPEVDAIKGEQQKIAAAQKKAHVPASQQLAFTSVEAPSCSVAGQQVDSGGRAQCFARYMRIHALGASSGLTYSQMGQFAAKPDAPVQSTDFNGGTSDPKYAQIDPKTGKPVSNGARNLWVTETGLSTALYLAYTGSAISLFGIVVGVALLLTGVGFVVLALAALPPGRPTEQTAAQPASVPT
jgi:uncharacterized iron-regulated membrane protein